MLINPASFSVAGTPLAMSDVRFIAPQRATSGEELVHCDEWAAQVRRSYSRPLKRHSLRIGLLLASMKMYHPVSSLLLTSSAIGIAFTLHLVLEHLSR